MVSWIGRKNQAGEKATRIETSRYNPQCLPQSMDNIGDS